METAGNENEGRELLLTIRLIRSFEHRNVKNLVLRHVSVSLTIGELKRLVNEQLKTAPGLPPPFRTFTYGNSKRSSLLMMSNTTYSFILRTFLNRHNEN